LLEIYYSAAASNRQAFLEAARKLGETGRLSGGDWSKVASMAREIAADDTLFPQEPAARSG
jgi:hypothetical protein